MTTKNKVDLTNAPSKEETERLIKERKNVLLQLRQINAGYDEMIRRILTPELQAELDSIEAERRSATDGGIKRATELEAKIRAGVLAYGDTITVPGYTMVTWNKGKTSWKSTDLESLFDKHPELDIEDYREKGEPSTSLRELD